MSPLTKSSESDRQLLIFIFSFRDPSGGLRKQLLQWPKPTCRASLALSMRWFVSARSVASKSGAPSSALSRWNLLDMLSSDSAFCAAEADRGALLSRVARLDLASSIVPGGVPQREELLGRAARGPPKPILMLWERVRGRTRPADSFELYKVVSPSLSDQSFCFQRSPPASHLLGASSVPRLFVGSSSSPLLVPPPPPRPRGPVSSSFFSLVALLPPSSLQSSLPPSCLEWPGKRRQESRGDVRVPWFKRRASVILFLLVVFARG